MVAAIRIQYRTGGGQLWAGPGRFAGVDAGIAGRPCVVAAWSDRSGGSMSRGRSDVRGGARLQIQRARVERSQVASWSRIAIALVSRRVAAHGKSGKAF